MFSYYYADKLLCYDEVASSKFDYEIFAHFTHSEPYGFEYMFCFDSTISRLSHLKISLVTTASQFKSIAKKIALFSQQLYFNSKVKYTVGNNAISYLK